MVATLLNEENQKSEEEHEQWKRDGMQGTSFFDIGDNHENALGTKSDSESEAKNLITNCFTPRA